MRRVALAWALALPGLWIVGCAADWLPRGWLPDPALLVAIAAGLRMAGVPGALAAAAVGWTADALSSGPLGTHALLDLAAWGLTRAAQRRVDLGRGVVLVPFAAALAVAHAAGEWALGGIPAAGRDVFAILLPHAVANGVAVLAVRRLLDAGLGLLDEDEALRGSLRLDAGSGMR